MSGNGNGAAARGVRGDGFPSGTDEHDSRVEGLSTGWTVFSYLIGGMIAYGAIGWLIGKAVHVGLLFPLGMLVGLGISLGYVIYRFGRQAAAVDGQRAAGRQRMVDGQRAGEKQHAGDGRGSVERNDR